MTHSLIYNAYIPDDFLIPYGGMQAAAVLINTREFPDTVYVKVSCWAWRSLPEAEFAAAMIGACVNHHYIIEYDESAKDEAEHLTKLIEMIEGVCI